MRLKLGICRDVSHDTIKIDNMSLMRLKLDFFPLDFCRLPFAFFIYLHYEL